METSAIQISFAGTIKDFSYSDKSKLKDIYDKMMAVKSHNHMYYYYELPTESITDLMLRLNNLGYILILSFPEEDKSVVAVRLTKILQT